MKGQLFRSTMLAMAIMLVLTSSISAGTKPPDVTTLTVGSWVPMYYTDTTTGITTVSYLAAMDISWPGADKGKELALSFVAMKAADVNGDGEKELVTLYVPELVRVAARSPFAILEADTSITLVDPLPDETCYFIPRVTLYDGKGNSLNSVAVDPTMGTFPIWEFLIDKCLVLSP